MYFLEKMSDDDEDDFESKFVNEINCISHVEIKEEVIIPENISDGESTLSDNEKNPNAKLAECIICCKYRAMFIILKNHDCQSENNEKCQFCAEILHWSNCFKSHKESHHIEKESDFSSDSTASDCEENDGNCEICLKYEFMVPLLKSHICQSSVDNKKCPDCSEVLHWMTCYKKHVESHKEKKCFIKVKEENSSDSTISDNEEIQKLLSPIGKIQYENCQVCLKYQAMFIILEENHMCDVEKPNKNCKKCSEIIEWYSCFDKHRKTHQGNEKNIANNDVPVKDFLHFGGKFDCGICLKLNSIVIHLVKNHKCFDNRTCAVCQEVSYWLSCLKNHKQAESPTDLSNIDEPESFKSLGQETNCAVCSKFRANIVNLSDHFCRRKRGREKCQVCFEVSFWFKNFKHHEKHHAKQISSFRNFLSCFSCGKRFSGEKMLDVHKSYCRSSDFTCDMCDKKFINMFSLKKHKIFQLCRSSAISLKYNCKICKKTFSNSSDCKNHEEFHDLKIFKCVQRINEFNSEIFLDEKPRRHFDLS